MLLLQSFLLAITKTFCDEKLQTISTKLKQQCLMSRNGSFSRKALRIFPKKRYRSVEKYAADFYFEALRIFQKRRCRSLTKRYRSLKKRIRSYKKGVMDLPIEEKDLAVGRCL